MSNDAKSWQEMLFAARDEFSDADEQSSGQDKPQFAEKEELNSSVLEIVLEKKGRGGKVATIISGFTISDEKILQIASKLKSKLATGGSARGGDILVQGDRRKEVLEFLKSLGMKARII